MPLNEFLCSKCGHSEEVLRKMHLRDDFHSCEECGAPSLRQLTCGSFFGSSTNSESDSRVPTEEPNSSNDGGIQIHNCRIEGARVGISAPKGTKLNMSGNKFINVKTPVEFRDE